MLILLQVGLWAARSVRFYLEIKELERGADRRLRGLARTSSISWQAY